MLTLAQRVLSYFGRRARRRRPRGGSRRIASLLLCLCCSVAHADDPRSTYLIKLLEGSSQFRVRAQAAISLGTVEASRVAVEALNKALRDVHPAVRAAAATSLGRVGDANSLAALRVLERDSEEPVRSAARAAVGKLASGPPPDKRGEPVPEPTPIGPALYYVAVAEPATRVPNVDRQLLLNAHAFIKQRVAQLQGVRLAPDSETAQAAEQVLKRQRLKGFYLDSSIVSVEKRPSGETRIAVSVIVATYPGRDMRAIMQGAATVSGAGSQTYHQALEGAYSGALRQLSQAFSR